MPIHVTCESCRGEFNAPDTAGGKRAKCPTCGNGIQIPVQAVAMMPVAAVDPGTAYSNSFGSDAPAAIAIGEERKQCPMCGELIAANAVKCRFCGELLDASLRGMIASAGNAGDPGWRRVRSGLAVLYYSIAAIIVAAILMGIAAALAAAVAGQRGNEPPILVILPLIIGGLVIFGAAIGTLVGQVLCINVPEASDAKGFITGAIVCVVANILLSMVGAVIPLAGMLGSLASFVGNVLFILFIRQSATYLGDQRLAGSAFNFLMFGVAIFVGAVMLGVAAGVGQSAWLVALLGLALIVCGLVALVWYLKLITSLMATIDQRTKVQ